MEREEEKDSKEGDRVKINKCKTTRAADNSMGLKQ